ncbi:hypothetical protein [Pseudonocardia sp. NPDC049635]
MPGTVFLRETASTPGPDPVVGAGRGGRMTGAPRRDAAHGALKIDNSR